MMRPTIILILFFLLHENVSGQVVWKMVSDDKKIIETNESTLYTISDLNYSYDLAIVFFDASLSKLLQKFFQENNIAFKSEDRFFIYFKVTIEKGAPVLSVSRYYYSKSSVWKTNFEKHQDKLEKNLLSQRYQFFLHYDFINDNHKIFNFTTIFIAK